MGKKVNIDPVSVRKIRGVFIWGGAFIGKFTAEDICPRITMQSIKILLHTRV